MKSEHLKYYLIFSTVLFVNIVAAQGEFSQLKVVYEFKHVRDLRQKNSPYISDMVLSIGKTSSIYTSQFLYSVNLENKNDSSGNARKGAGVSAGRHVEREMAIGPAIEVTKYGIAEIQEIYKDFSDQKMEINANLGIKLLYVESPVPKINWEFQSDKKKIGEYNCQKATCHFGGRKYEAWFTPELPYRDGPWKLNGLPGLVLEASDSTNEIAFKFKNLVHNNLKQEFVRPFLHSDYANKISVKDYNKLTAAFLSDPETFTLTGLPGGVKIFFVDIEGGTSVENNTYKIKKFNPLEKTL
ncbi:GLPGLI family protein [Danxiaibacter flavus]|uniref:GLPGLI family protein n=1 Tax=Danxiaibacter flavus TaxID=3049108 RepID=A0ABV3ZN58_9BACT|nr:GLPGLI family protein [Chitinophagaceae bacterium DXS]